MRRLVGVVALGVMALAACGQSDEEKAEETAVAYFEAIGDGDYEGACGMNVDDFDLGGKLRGFSGDCEEALSDIAVEHSFDLPEATGVDISGDKAEVQIESEGRTYTAQLEKDGDDWKVDAFDPSAPF